jgi:hypothetical protein
MINEIRNSSPHMCVRINLFSLVFIDFCFFHKQNGTPGGTRFSSYLCCALMVVKYFYDGTVIQLCIYRMLDASILLKLEGCVATRKQLHVYYITARMMPLPTTCMTENLNKKNLVMSFLQ